MDADGIEQALLIELRQTRHDDLFSGASAVDVFLSIKKAAKTMVDEGRTGEDDLQLARSSLGSLLLHMEGARNDRGLSEFHEITVSGALRSMCPPPKWPWC